MGEEQTSSGDDDIITESDVGAEKQIKHLGLWTSIGDSWSRRSCRICISLKGSKQLHTGGHSNAEKN